MSAKRQLEELFSPSQAEEPEALIAAAENKSTKKATTPTLGKAKPQALPIESNFRRSMSLRLPKKTSPKPLPKNKPSSVQSGISDDGPISSNFLKPEQYDEIPVRSVYSTLATNASLSPSSSTAVAAVLRDQESIPNRRNLKLNLHKINLPSLELPISKTDSLAAFLNYEKHLGLSSFSEKDLKDTNNILNKQSTMQSVAETDDAAGDAVDQLERTPSSDPDSSRASLVVREPQKPYVRVILSPIVKGSMQLLTDNCGAQEDYIDPKLINECDNLDTKSSCSTEVNGNGHQPLLSHSSSERKVQLKRQMKFQIDNILYDKTPNPASETSESDPFVEPDDCVKEKVHMAPTPTKPLEKYFDDFDFEEFINSFEDDEQNPIFKDYKEMLQSNSKLNEDSDTEDDKDRFCADPKDTEVNREDRNDQPVTNDFISTDSSYGRFVVYLHSLNV